ncbi:MAG: calcium/sodium antiporter [Desulfobacteraceae bacterium]|jgi:cation:H+ antiporter
MTYYLLICIAGFILLYFSAEWLVKGSSSLARSLGITPIVIGLTVVAFGTSAPELVVSLISALDGRSMMAVGNVIGSNICNIALVLGLSTVFQPITCSVDVVKREIPVMMGISLFLLLLSWNSIIGRVEGAVLFGGVIAYTVMSYKIAMKQRNKNNRDNTGFTAELDEIGHVSKRSSQIIMIIIGIAGVAFGAKIIVFCAERIMEVLGVGEKFISLTLLAFGTSLPELTTSVVAAIRKEMDISIGNLIGSNIFNILSVLGTVSLVSPIIISGGFVESGLIIDYVVMMFTSFLPFIMMRKTHTISRFNGITLLICYSGYLSYLIMTMKI